MKDFLKGLVNTVLVILLANTVVGCMGFHPASTVKSIVEVSAEAIKETDETYKAKTTKPQTSDPISAIDVYYIDVGQGDSTLITEGDGHGVLIDTGAYWGYDNVVAVLAEANVDVIDMLILTHPDADHIQNADDLIEAYEVVNVIMPDVKKDTNSFKDLVSSISENSVNVVYPDGKLTVPYGSVQFDIYSPQGEYEDINSYSLITKLTAGEKSFLFLGDATGEEIDEIALTDIDFRSDVMKAAHHGSANCGCNSEWLFNAVDPAYVVISCGYQNDYGHPHRETMGIVTTKGIDTFRTDLQGTILCRCDGVSLTWNTEPTTVFTCGSDL